MPELGIEPARMGLLLAAFFFTYSSCQVVAGWIVDRFDVSRVYGYGFLLWSAATVATGFANSFWVLFALRLVLGAGEAVAYPAYSKILTEYFPEHRRGFLNALVDAGTKAGPALGTLVGGLIIARFGWRVFFIAFGLVTMFWLWPWMRAVPRRGSASVLGNARAGPSMRAILGRPEAIAACCGLFCFNYAYYFLLTWLPAYLVRERHFSMERMSVMASIPFWGIAIVSIFFGWLSDRLILSGSSPTKVRKGIAVAGLLGGMLLLPAAVAPDANLSMALLIAACLACGMYTSNAWAISQTLAGPAAGKWTGLQNGFGNLGGVAAPILTGWIVQKTGVFFLAFAAATACLGISAFVYAFVIRRVEPVAWPETG
jgi:MFS family permease